MSFLLSFLFVLIAAAVVVFKTKAGLWTIIISLVNVVTAALVATNLFEPIADFLTKNAPSATYLWDLIALWGVFAAAYAVMKAVTDRVSRFRVKLPKTVEMLGSMLLLTVMAWVVICFTAFSLHMAPLARNFMGGGFEPEKPVFFSVLYPDRLWLGFMQGQSLGGLGRSGTEQNPELHVFDPQSEFMIKYAARREKFESFRSMFVDRGQ